MPVSGGGLISGIALALKSHNPFIEIIGVCAESGIISFPCPFSHLISLLCGINV